MSKKYYWLKLKRDFFKRHDIKIVESMDNGKDYLLFYMKLLVESIDHEGALRFSDTLPYNEKMLASITDTNIDIVRTAIKIFSELGMLDIMDDGTLFMAQVVTMIGDETEWAERKRTYRLKAKDKPLEIEGQKRTLSDKSIELEIDKELDKEISKTRHVYGKERNVKLTDDQFNHLISTYGQSNTMAIIDELSDYKAMTGRKYLRDDLAISKWVAKKVMDRVKSSTTPDLAPPPQEFMDSYESNYGSHT